MSTFKIEIETDNAAFEDDARNAEVARILRSIAKRLDGGCDRGMVNDINGNHVGLFEFKR